jgi:hypothetical protein
LGATINIVDNWSSGIRPILSWYDSGGAFISSDTGAFVTGTGLVTLSLNGVAPSTAAFVSLSIDAISTANNDTLDAYIDAVWLSRFNAGYSDGSQSGYTWAGTAHQSATVQSATTTYIRDAIIAVKPAGIVLEVVIADGTIYDALVGTYNAQGATYDNL